MSQGYVPARRFPDAAPLLLENPGRLVAADMGALPGALPGRGGAAANGSVAGGARHLARATVPASANPQLVANLVNGLPFAGNGPSSERPAAAPPLASATPASAPDPMRPIMTARGTVVARSTPGEPTPPPAVVAPLGVVAPAAEVAPPPLVTPPAMVGDVPPQPRSDVAPPPRLDEVAPPSPVMTPPPGLIQVPEAAAVKPGAETPEVGSPAVSVGNEASPWLKEVGAAPIPRAYTPEPPPEDKPLPKATVTAEKRGAPIGIILAAVVVIGLVVAGVLFKDAIVKVVSGARATKPESTAVEVAPKTAPTHDAAGTSAPTATETAGDTAKPPPLPPPTLPPATATATTPPHGGGTFHPPPPKPTGAPQAPPKFDPSGI